MRRSILLGSRDRRPRSERASRDYENAGERVDWLVSPGAIRLVKDTLDLRSILLDFDIPTNPALIEQLIRWKRYPYAPFEVLR